VGNKEKVLVVEDEESIRFTFEVFLSEEGYDVVTADSYEEGLALIREKEFDLAFIDLFLEGKSGLNLLQEIKGRDMRCQVVVVTGSPAEDSASDAFRLGIFDYLPKPVRKEKLLQVAKDALSGRKK
jgi:DNA-binding NtrC family response regulator